MKKLARLASRFGSPYPFVSRGLAFPSFRFAFSFGLVALLLVSAMASAFAAETTVAVDGFYAVLQPYLIAAVSAAISVLVGWVLVLLKSKLNLSIDDSMRASLQTAATNAAGLVLNKLGNQLAGKTIDVKNTFIKDSVDYVLKAAPDAVAHFGLTPDSIAEKITALLPQVANTTVAPAAVK